MKLKLFLTQCVKTQSFIIGNEVHVPGIQIYKKNLTTFCLPISGIYSYELKYFS